MEAETIVLICLCAAMLGVIVWLVVKKWTGMSQECKNILVDKGKALVECAADALKNDGKIDKTEMCAIMNHMIGIISYLSNQSTAAVRIQTGTEELLAEKTETATN